MEIPPTILIIAGFILIVLGIGAGMLLSSLTEEGDAEEGAADLTPPGGRKGRYTPVVRLWRERDAGTLVVEMDGKSYLGPETLTDAQREPLERAVRELRGWLGMGLTGAASEAPVQPPQQPGVIPLGPGTVSAVETPYTSAPAPRPMPAAARPVVPGIDEPALPNAGPKSIVNQIEDILQDMIAQTPLERQGLHLTEDPTRGVLVWVAGVRYEGIEAVPEGEAKNAIRAAVAEWEKTAGTF